MSTEIRATSLGIPGVTQPVTITLTPQEAALVHHVRGHCHLSTDCALCTVERDLYNTRRDAERDRHRAFAHALTLLDRAHKAERELDRIISG